MKKKIIVIALLLITAVSFTALYRSYGRKRSYDYVRFFARFPLVQNLRLTIGDNVELESIIKQTPRMLIILVKWGNNEKAYINIENWATRAHDTIVIHVVDKDKSIRIQE